MLHRYHVGQSVYFTPRFTASSSRGTYKVVRLLPVENDNSNRYRIKSASEAFDRIADESQLSGHD